MMTVRSQEIVCSGMHRSGVLIDGMQAHSSALGRYALISRTGPRARVLLGARFLDPRGSPLCPQVVDAAHRILVRG